MRYYLADMDTEKVIGSIDIESELTVESVQNAVWQKYTKSVILIEKDNDVLFVDLLK